jgi:hypothetical protein
MAKRLIALAVLLSCDVGLVLAQAQNPDYSWDGWHKVPDPSSIQYRVFHNKVVALSNLGKGCQPGSSFSFAGKIAKVNFDDQGLTIQNFILERSDGDRSLVNVDPVSLNAPGMNMADLSWIVQGLQTLLRPHLYIEGRALACGAAGRVLVLDNVVRASSTARASSQPNASGNSTQPHSSQTAANVAEGIPLSVEGGTFVIPVVINGQITLNFTIDSGAADVSVPADVVSTLIRTGTVEKSDFVGQKSIGWRTVRLFLQRLF